MEGEGGFGAVGDVDFAEGVVIVEGAIDVGEHHIDFGILEIQAEQDERAFELVLGDAHGLLPEAALTAAPAGAAPAARRGGGRRLLREGWPRGG